MGTVSGLPNAKFAYVPPGKVSGYLLSLSHSFGRSKALFFRGLGYNDENAKMLEVELLRLAREGELIDRIPGKYGTKYIIQGRIRSPSGTQALLTTVWLIEKDEIHPRLVTAYPLQK